MKPVLDENVIGRNHFWMKVFLDESVFGRKCFWMSFFFRIWMKVYLTVHDLQHHQVVRSQVPLVHAVGSSLRVPHRPTGSERTTKQSTCFCFLEKLSFPVCVAHRALLCALGCSAFCEPSST